jgi:2,4-dienoyl-CoA reductase-like NADH-dependent reductase (Old Yellow Enzyme family)
MKMRNRIVRSATWEGMCDPDGRPTQKLINCYEDLVRGMVGLIISGYTFVRPDGKGLQGKMSIHTDNFENDFKKLTHAVHAAGGTIVIQLVHAGGQTTAKNAGRQPLAPSSVEIDDAMYAAKELARAGIDAIEVSAGTPASGSKTAAREKINSPEKEAYNLELALEIKKHVDCPVMVVGGFRSYEVIEKTLRDNDVSYIAMSRPFIREPGIVNRWLQGDRKPARCISCNGCFKPGREEGGIYCVVEKKENEKAAKRYPFS